MSQSGEFSRFVAEFGSSEEEDEKQAEDGENTIDVSAAKADAEREMKKAVAGDAMMQKEERNTGAISGEVYKSYLKAGKGSIIMPFMLLSLVLLQGATILSSYWFVDYLTIPSTFD